MRRFIPFTLVSLAVLLIAITLGFFAVYMTFWQQIPPVITGRASPSLNPALDISTASQGTDIGVTQPATPSVSPQIAVLGAQFEALNLDYDSMATDQLIAETDRLVVQSETAVSADQSDKKTENQ